MIDLKVEEGVEGPARVVVPISENPVIRAVFNGVTESELGRPCQTADEMEKMFDKATDEYQGEIEDVLAGKEIVPESDDDLRDLSREVAQELGS